MSLGMRLEGWRAIEGCGGMEGRGRREGAQNLYDHKVSAYIPAS